MRSTAFALILGFAPTFTATAAARFPEGTYACPLQYIEAVDVEIDQGADFPKPGRNLDEPRLRKETLRVRFGVESGEGRATVLNGAQALPNWLFVKKSNEMDQNSWSDDGVHYTIDWPRTWYFGSRVEIQLLGEERGDLLRANVRFDDNDGWSQEIENVACTRE